MLIVDDDDEGEAIGDDDTVEWIDEVPTTAGESTFGAVEIDADLDAPELEELLADTPLTNKRVRMVAEDVMSAESEEDGDEDSDPPPMTLPSKQRFSVL